MSFNSDGVPLDEAQAVSWVLHQGHIVDSNQHRSKQPPVKIDDPFLLVMDGKKNTVAPLFSVSPVAQLGQLPVPSST